MPTAIVIGASSGIGRQIAIQLCDRGFRVGVAARRERMLTDLAESIGTERCVPQILDAADVKGAVRGFEQLCARLGQVEYVYLVAGTGFPNPALEGALEDATISTNCLGFSALAAAAMRLFAAQNRGHLVAVTSVAAARPSGSAPAYGASKAFASSYVEALRY